MKHAVLFAASAVTLLLGARLAGAQPAPPSFDAIDKNKDGVLTKDEVVAFFEARRAAGGGGGAAAGGAPPDPAQLCARRDAKGDGKVTNAEFAARPRPGGAGGGHPPPGSGK
jgi:hypothetical protein